MDVRTVPITFPSVHGYGPQTQIVPVYFPRRVINAAVALCGYSARYSSGDHELRQLTVVADVEIGTEPVDLEFGRFWPVHVVAKLGLRDASGNWDDAYEGEIECSVFAELTHHPLDDLSAVGAQL